MLILAGFPNDEYDINYVGFYADIDDNGTVDGIIYADLLVGNTGSGKCGDENSELGNTVIFYTIPKINNAKKYYICKESYSGPFGTRPVLAPVKGSEGGDRFYVMALTDIEKEDSDESYTWYYNASGNMNDYKETTSMDFGAGKQNTNNLMDKWERETYGEQYDYTEGYGEWTSRRRDLWGLIKNQVLQEWFVPSIAEWAAFIDQLNIPKVTDDSHCGLEWCYWSSTQGDNGNSYVAYLGIKDVFGGLSESVQGSNSVRLSTTF